MWSPPTSGKIPKGVPVPASGDTPLLVTEIVHANPHAAGGSNLSNNTEKTSRRKAKILEAAARMDKMKKMQGEMREAQDKISAQ